MDRLIGGEYKEAKTVSTSTASEKVDGAAGTEGKDATPPTGESQSYEYIEYSKPLDRGCQRWWHPSEQEWSYEIMVVAFFMWFVFRKR